jgi:hypothetical protein
VARGPSRRRRVVPPPEGDDGQSKRKSASTTRVTTSRSTSFFLRRGRVTQSRGGKPIDLAQRAMREFVQAHEGVVGEEGTVRAGGGEPKTHVFGRVFDGGRRDQEAVVDAGQQGSMRPPRQIGLELGQAHEQKRSAKKRKSLVARKATRSAQRSFCNTK